VIAMKFGALMHIDHLNLVDCLKFTNFCKFKTADSCHFEKLKIHHMSPTVYPTATIFGKVMHTAPLNDAGSYNFQI